MEAADNSSLKRPEFLTRHETVMFHHDNARPHVARPVKSYVRNNDWEILFQTPYSPDLSASDYNLFWLM